MMKHEFEALAGYEVSTKDYNEIIEPMYMALPSTTKADFVQMIDKKRFALPSLKKLLSEAKKEANHLYEICGHYTDYDSERRLERIAKEYAERKYHLNWANDIKAYCYFIPEYEFPSIRRGCTYPKILVIGHCGVGDYERIILVK